MKIYYHIVRLLSIVLIWIFTISCVDNHIQILSGDLLFQSDTVGEMSSAIEDATARNGRNFTHVAIAVACGDSIVVLEASTRNGTVVTSLNDFMQRSALGNGKYSVAIGRLKDTTGLASSIKTAMAHIGVPYDYAFLPDNGALYCSELIYESYLRPDGKHIFSSAPMNFRSTTGSMPQFWTDLFASQGCEVPEGVEGTNPNDMSGAEALQIVHRYF